jgi:phospho-N-acetylmuramoyl-pentapeptide-transferase
MNIELIKIILPSVVAFTIGMAFTPILTNFLYKHKMWKKKAKTVSLGGGGTPVFDSLHGEKKEVGTPRMGGIVIWVSVIVTTLGFWLLGHIFPAGIFAKLDFLSRGQTWIPLFVFMCGAFVGLIDDLLEINGAGGNYAGGLSLRKRLAIVSIISFLISLWFYFKLDVNTISVPFMGTLMVGIFFIPIFILVTVFIYSGTVIDGIDGLSGGVFSAIFFAYAVIAYFQNQINLSAFCIVVVGSILAFLWFNIPPARFYMTETGSMALTMTIAIVAFMTDSLGHGRGLTVLPIIALPLIVTSLSDIIQVVSKKTRNGKKVFRIAPLHHHFEAIGWPAYKVTMRYWIVSIVCAVLGVIFALVKI